MLYKDHALLIDTKCKILASFKNNQAEVKGLCYAEGMEDALMWKLDCHHGHCVYFVDENISGSSVDESGLAVLFLHFSPVTSSAAAFE